MPLGQCGQRARFRAAGEAPADPSVLHEVTFTNTSASSSTGLVKFGLAFEKTDVPTGQIPKVRIKDGAEVRGWPIETATWSDGSLRKATMVADVGAVSGSSTVTIEVYNDTGSVTASSLTPATYVAGLASDHTVDITSRTGSTTGSMGDLAYSMKTASAVSTKRETQADTDLFVRYFCWEKLSGEEHLVCLNYLDIWLDTDGSTVLAHEWVPVLSQHWWVNDPEGVEQAKEKYTYDAAVKVGASAVDSRTALAHAYYCRWASLYSADDAQHATPHWIDAGSTTKPTLSIAYSTASRKKLFRAGSLPPLDWSESDWVLTATDDYTPLATNGHRASINDGGAYVGRGAITRMDANAIGLQSVAAWRIARVGAQAGLSCYQHVCDHRVIDTTPKPVMFPGKIGQKGAQSYTGLGAEINLAAQFYTELTRDEASGGTGAFTNFDTAHGVTYSQMMAFVSGERYLRDASIGTVQLFLTFQHVNTPRRLYGDQGFGSVRGTEYSIPTDMYGQMASLVTSERAKGWWANALLQTYTLLDDYDPHVPYFENLVEDYGSLLEDSFDYFPSEQLAYGGIGFANGGRYLLWMENFQLITTVQHLGLIADKSLTVNGYNEYIEMMAKLFKNNSDLDGQYALGAFISNFPCDADYINWIADELHQYEHTSTYTFTSDTCTKTTAHTRGIANGDRVQVATTNSSGAASTVPDGLAVGQTYYMIDVSGDSFKLSETLGGAAVTHTNSGTCYLFLSLASFADALGSVSSDSYFSIARAAIVSAKLAGADSMTSEVFSDLSTYLNIDQADYSPWGYSEDQI